MVARIICVGNRLVPEDALGPRVYDRLRDAELPARVEVVDGGLHGLNLLGIVDGTRRVIFVDSLAGFSRPGELVELSASEASAGADGPLGHDSGLGYLLRAVPLACDEPPSTVIVLGCEGEPDESLVERVASRALSLALGGTS